MTKVKGIGTRQIVVEILECLVLFIAGAMMNSLAVEESHTFSFSNSNETIYQLLTGICIILGAIQLVCMFKKMGNYVEIQSEKISVKTFQLTALASATKIAEIEYKDIKSVNMEKKGIVPRLVINTTTEQYKIDIKDVDRLIPMIKQKAGLK